MQINIGQIFGGVGRASRQEVGHLGEPVRDGQNGVKSIASGEVEDMVHLDVSPRLERDGQWLQEA